MGLSHEREGPRCCNLLFSDLVKSATVDVSASTKRFSKDTESVRLKLQVFLFFTIHSEIILLDNLLKLK